MNIGIHFKFASRAALMGFRANLPSMISGFFAEGLPALILRSNLSRHSNDQQNTADPPTSQCGSTGSQAHRREKRLGLARSILDLGRNGFHFPLSVAVPDRDLKGAVDVW
jgi:hypothetical protein